jgi:hypothetical protein
MSRNSAIVATLLLVATVILTKPELVVAQKNKPDPTPPSTKPSAPTAPAGSSSTNMSAANEAFMKLELLVTQQRPGAFSMIRMIGKATASHVCLRTSGLCPLDLNYPLD